MKIQHVILSYSDHFLVVDGTRGPLQQIPAHPAMHPAGVAAYRKDGWGTPGDLKGKVFLVLDAADFEVIEDTVCEPGQEAYKKFVEIQQTCTEVKLARYGEPATEAVEVAP